MGKRRIARFKKTATRPDNQKEIYEYVSDGNNE